MLILDAALSMSAMIVGRQFQGSRSDVLLEIDEQADQKISERCTAMPAVTPSALAHVTLCTSRVMSPAA